MGRQLTALRERLTYANVVATLALFVALGGVSFAAVTLPRNSVGSKQLKAGAVTAKKLQDGAVTAAKLKRGTITGKRLKKATITHRELNMRRLGTVPNAAKLGGLGAGAFLRSGGPAPDSAALGGIPAARYLSLGGLLPPGATATGAFGGLAHQVDRFEAVVSFPMPTATPVTADDIHFAPGTNAVMPEKIDPACAGSVLQPVAPPGRVCLYLGQIGTDTNNVVGVVSGLDGRRGFTVRATGTTMAGEPIPGFQGAAGSWAYTAP